MSAIKSVRELHEPEHQTYSGLCCSGCPWDTEEGAPSWPCQTAALVYSKEEVREVVETFRSWAKWGQARQYRAKMSRPIPKPSIWNKVYSAQILFQCQPVLRFDQIRGNV